MSHAGKLARRSSASHRQILFFDDFNGPANSGVNTSKWTQDVGRYSADQGGNDYCTSGTSNVYIDGSSNLIVQVKQNQVTPDSAAYPDNVTSGRITTKFKASFLPPFRAEARIKLPVAQGLLPAFWTCGVKPDGSWTEDWPKYGEIDIAELEGGIETNAIDTYLHMGMLADMTTDAPLGDVTPIDGVGSAADSDYFIYGVDVYSDKVVYCINGQIKQTFTAADAAANGADWPFDNSPQFLLFTVYAGPDWMTELNTSQNPLPPMVVDWVQVTSL